MSKRLRLSPEARTGHLVRLIERRLGQSILEAAWSAAGEDRVRVARERLVGLLTFVRDDPDADLGLLVDITAVDRCPEPEEQTGRPAKSTPPRFQVLYRLRSPRLSYRLLVLTDVPDDDPVVPSVSALFRAADWLERELWDLFGIYPDGHPYLRRLLLYTGFSGHPLRRDYPFTKAQPLVPLREPPLAPIVISSRADEAEGAF